MTTSITEPSTTLCKYYIKKVSGVVKVYDPSVTNKDEYNNELYTHQLECQDDPYSNDCLLTTPNSLPTYFKKSTTLIITKDNKVFSTVNKDDFYNEYVEATPTNDILSYATQEYELFIEKVKKTPEISESDITMELVIKDLVLECLELISSRVDTTSGCMYVLQKLNKLLKFNPLIELLGIDDEWFEFDSDENYIHYQNTRCPSVFKILNKSDNTVQTYQQGSIVFTDENGSQYTNKYSNKIITFPYDGPKYSVLNHKESVDYMSRVDELVNKNKSI